MSLHGLDEEERDVLTLQLLLERVDVSPRDVRELRQERAESLREVGVTARGERPERQAVETAFRRDDARTAGRGTPELQRGLDGLRPRAREQHARKPGRGPAQQLLPQQPR